MTITLDISNDFNIFDNRQSVTLTSQNGATVSGTISALKEELTSPELPQGQVNLEVIRTRWHLFRVELGTQVPQQHGYITDGNGVKHYIDDNPKLASWDTRYVVETTAQAGAVLQKSLA